MGSWILVVIAFGAGQSLTFEINTSARFFTEKSCVTAAERVIAEDRTFESYFYRNRLRAFCVHDGS